MRGDASGMAAGCLRLSAPEGEEPRRQVICLSFRFGSQVAAAMPRFLIDSHCNGHTAQDCEGVELDSVEHAGAHALAAAPQMFNDLMPGERRECGFSVRDESQGWRLKIDLSLCLEKRDPASDALDTGALGERTEYSS